MFRNLKKGNKFGMESKIYVYSMVVTVCESDGIELRILEFSLCCSVKGVCSVAKSFIRKNDVCNGSGFCKPQPDAYSSVERCYKSTLALDRSKLFCRDGTLKNLIKKGPKV